MHRIESVLLIILGLLGATARISAANTNALPRLNLEAVPIRLAVATFVSGSDRTELKEQSTNLTDLLTVRLSQSSKFQLVERQAIDSVTEEISLSLSQVSKPADAIRIGKMLRADWLLVGSFLENAATNTIIVKILDAQTGIMRDLTAVSVNRANASETVSAIADFVNDSASGTSNAEPRIFFGIGGFEDLSINNRYPDFRKGLRADLEKHFHGSRYTLVERSAVEPLLTELRLNLGGLTDNTVPSKLAQPAFLLVDGSYQSYQDTDAKVNLVLRVQEIGAGQNFYSFNEQPGQGLNEKVAAALNRALADLRQSGGSSTRKEEAVAQVARGMERCRVDVMGYGDYNLGGYSLDAEAEKRLKNIAEGMEAFEAALLLDPDNAKAKICLAACLLDRAIKREEEGRNYLREVIAGSSDGVIVRAARLRLALSYAAKNPVQTLNLLIALARDTPDPCERTKVVEHIIALRGDFLDRPKPFSAEKGAEILEMLLMDDCEAANNPGCYRHGFHTSVDRGRRFGELQSLVGYRTQSAEDCFEKILPGITEKFPIAAGRIWMSYALWRQQMGSRPPELVWEHVRACLQRYVDNPEIFPGLEVWMYDLPFFFRWSVEQGEFKSADIISNFRVNGLGPLDNSAQTYYYRGFCYRGLGNWREAAEAFTIAQTNAESLVMGADGPWGREGTKVLASDLLGECRQHLASAESVVLEKSAHENPEPLSFSLGQPILTFGNDVVFASDGNDIWAADGTIMLHFNNSLRTWTRLHRQLEVKTNITCICADEKTVWWGTAGDGLVEMDKQTKTCKVYTEKDGLLLNQIVKLALDGEKLWIGFTQNRAGGVGYLDLHSHRFIGLTPELDLRSVTNRSAYLGLPSKTVAPRYPIHGLVATSAENLWVLADESGLQNYLSTKNDWRAFDQHTPIYCDCLSANSEYVVRAGNGGVVEIRNLRNGQIRTLSFRNRVAPRPYCTDHYNVDIYSLKIMGKRTWVGGEGFVALIDLESGRIEQLCDFSPNKMVSVQDLQIDGDLLWVAAEQNLYRLPLEKFNPH